MSALTTSKASTAQPTEVLPPRPFPGLRAYQDCESRIMCGRLEHRLELLRLLEASRFLAVLGTSGSGKSSLVFAGLLPDICQGRLVGVDAGSKRIIQTHPGLSPLKNLVKALEAAGPEARDVAGIVNGGAASLAHHLRLGDFNPVEEGAKTQLTSAVIYVDQFEELFGYIDAKAGPADNSPGAGENAAPAGEEDAFGQAQTYVRFLIECSKQNEFPIYVVLSMRSDFIWRCESFPGLAREVSRSQFHTARLERRQVEEAIRRPLKMYGSSIDDELVTTLLNQAPSEADQLPAVQHVLFRLWKFAPQEGSGRHLRLDDFKGEHIGGYERSLEIHAQEVVGRLSEELEAEEEAIELQTQQLFCALATYSEKTQVGQVNANLWVRRRVRFGELLSETGIDEKRFRRLLDAFRDDDCCFLLPPKSGPNGKGTLEKGDMIQVSHESLFRRWQPLAAWLAEERERYEIIERYHEAIRESKWKSQAQPQMLVATRTRLPWVARMWNILLGTNELASGWLQNSSSKYLSKAPSPCDIGWGKSRGFDMEELHKAWRENARILGDHFIRKMMTPILVLFLVLVLIAASGILLNYSRIEGLAKQLSEKITTQEETAKKLIAERVISNEATTKANEQSKVLARQKEEAEKLTSQTQTANKQLTAALRDRDAAFENLKLETKKLQDQKKESTAQFDFYTSRLDELIPELIRRSEEASTLKASTSVPALAGPKIIKDVSESAGGKPPAVRWMMGQDTPSIPAASMLFYETTGGGGSGSYGFGTSSTGFSLPKPLPAVFSINANGHKAVYIEGDRAKLLQWGGGITPLSMGPPEKVVDIVFDREDPDVVWMLYPSGLLRKVNPADAENGDNQELHLTPALTSQSKLVPLRENCLALVSAGKKGRLLALICDGKVVEMPAASVLRLPCALDSARHLLSTIPGGVSILSLADLQQNYDAAIQNAKTLSIEGEITSFSMLDDQDVEEDQRGLLAIGTANPALPHKGQLLVAHLPSFLKDASLAAPKVLPGNLDAITSVTWVKQAGSAMLTTADNNGQVLVWTKLWWHDTYDRVRYYEPRFASFGNAVTDTAVSPDGKYLAVATLKSIAVVPLLPAISATAESYDVHRSIKMSEPVSAPVPASVLHELTRSHPVEMQTVVRPARQRGVDYWKGGETGEVIPKEESLRLVTREDLSTGKARAEIKRLFISDLNPEEPLSAQLNPKEPFVAAQWNRQYTPSYFIKGAKVRVSRVDKNGTILKSMDVYPVDVIAEKVVKDGTLANNPRKMTISEGLVKALGLTAKDTVLVEIPMVNR